MTLSGRNACGVQALAQRCGKFAHMFTTLGLVFVVVTLYLPRGIAGLWARR